MPHVPVVMLIAAAAVLAGVVVVALGRGGELAFFPADYAPLRLDEISATDVVLFRPPQALWGYNAQATDEALSRIADALTERDIEIAALRQRVADLAAASPMAPRRGRRDPGRPDRADPPRPPDASLPSGPRDTQPSGPPSRDVSPPGLPRRDVSPPGPPPRDVSPSGPPSRGVPPAGDTGLRSRQSQPTDAKGAAPFGSGGEPPSRPSQMARDAERFGLGGAGAQPPAAPREQDPDQDTDPPREPAGEEDGW